MSRYHERFYEPECEYDCDNEFLDEEQRDYLDDQRMDMGYLEDDLEFYGEYDDDFSSVWNG